jgi:hypothetical protein
VKLPKLTKEQLCSYLTIAYHVLFLGGSTTLLNDYLSKIDDLREEIVRQADRAETVVRDVEGTAKDINKSVNQINKGLKDVKKACGRLF